MSGGGEHMATPSGDGIRIGFYEDWMLPQVVDMFAAEYHRDREQGEAEFRQFYEHPFQRPHGIRLVALDGERVCGFQSYFFWPYVFQGRELRTFQSGKSLVSPDYRGRRIFARLLNCLAETDRRPEIDLLMGFPVQTSYASFIRNQWSNPLNLTWYGRLVHPLSSIVSDAKPNGSDYFLDREAENVDHVYPENCFALSKDRRFAEWRKEYRAGDPGYLYFHHRENGKTIRFELKPEKRGRINQLIIGDIARESADPALLRGGLRALVRAARRHRFLTMISIAANAECSETTLIRRLRRSGFIRLKPKIHFIVKQLGERTEAEDPRNWWLLRSDIDTW